MKELFLFSNPNDITLTRLKNKLKQNNDHIVFIPSNGITAKFIEKFQPLWQEFARECAKEITFLDLENENLLQNNINLIENCRNLIVSGGNGFHLLKLIEPYKRVLLNYFKQEDFLYAGFSAGAMLLTPTMALADIDPFFENREVGLENSDCLNILPYEIFPHYSDEFIDVLKNYQTKNQLILLSDEEVLEVIL